MGNKGVILIMSMGIVSGVFGIKASNTMQIESGGWDNRSATWTSDGISGSGSKIKTTKLAQTQTNNYDFIIGMNLSHALSEARNRECSIMCGLIQNIESDEKDESVKHVDFVVEEWLVGAGNESKNDLQLNFHTKASNKAMWNEKPFENTKLETGQRLILSYCPLYHYRLAVSEETYFPSIKQVIEYDALNIENESSDIILDRIRSENNRIFMGFVIHRLSGLGIHREVDNRAKVLIELVGKPTVPKEIWGRMLGTLGVFFEREHALTPSTREEIVKRLVKMGSGENVDEAEQAIILLASLNKSELIVLKDYLDNDSATRLRENYRSLIRRSNISPIPPEERQTFEEQLIPDQF